MIDARNVSVAYGDVDVLEDVSLSVARGEFVGLVGPNGAGKTTLLKTINAVMEPDSGSVAVDGADVHALSSRAASRRVATVPQDTTIAFEFSAEDVVEMGRTPYHGRFSGDPDSAVAVERALERTETVQFRDRSVGSLSGGERQRVVLARALAQETPALVLDEPTASLDINHQVQTLELVRDLTRSDGKAALAAIHDLDLAARFCDRVAILSEGSVLAAGSPEMVLTGDRLQTAFETEAAVLSNPVTGTPAVTPLPSTGDSDLSVHVAGAGQPAARALAAFATAGATVTAGVLPAGALAATTAREFGIEAVTAPPFAPLDAETEAAARDHLAAADVAVLAGPAPPAVKAIVRDHDAVVRVSTDPRESEDSFRPDASAEPAEIVAVTRRVARRRVEADD